MKLNLKWMLAVGLLSCAGLLAGAGQATADMLYGATGQGSPGNLLVLDPTTGNVIQDVGALHDSGGNLYGITGLAFQPGTGILYGSTSNSGTFNPAHLVRIDPLTALVTDIGSYTGGGASMSDIKFDKTTGILYGWRAASGHGLYTIDPNTGAATLVGGLTGDFGGGGLASDAAGVLYNTPDGATNPTPHLNTVDKLTGATLTSVAMTGAPQVPAMNALAFDSSGVLYGSLGPSSNGGTNYLVTIDPVTGAVTTIGLTASGLDAIDFQPLQAAPEPASLVLLAIGAAGAAGYGWRRRKANAAV